MSYRARSRIRERLAGRRADILVASCRRILHGAGGQKERSIYFIDFIVIYFLARFLL
jgi:hypothetical protein